MVDEDDSRVRKILAWAYRRIRPTTFVDFAALASSNFEAGQASMRQPPVPPAPSRARQKKGQDPRFFDGQWGEAATFRYTDAQGNQTVRAIRNWTSADGKIKGFCLKARQSRSFRQDRIEDWQEG
ncbi:hypothetical protein [Asticcacaulis biprosthecium]|uniref:hypothetical protein n=1 Tax=Asticcacaulis biprosthecium TaxID=76891 RepID=UPI0005908FB7|nr:hypothetical protein [Asticcacaulis biprosthecium]